MTFPGAFSTRAGLDIEPPAPVETDPYRALEATVRTARASSHSRRLDPPIQAALNGLADALGAVVDLARVQQRKLDELAREIEGIEVDGPHPVGDLAGRSGLNVMPLMTSR